MTHKEVSGMRQAERMAVGGEDEDEERHEAAATPQHGGGEEQERAEAAQTSTRAADLQKGVTVNRPKRSNRGQPGCMTRRIREGKRLNEVNDEHDGKKEGRAPNMGSKIMYQGEKARRWRFRKIWDFERSNQ